MNPPAGQSDGFQLSAAVENVGTRKDRSAGYQSTILNGSITSGSEGQTADNTTGMNVPARVVQCHTIRTASSESHSCTVSGAEGIQISMIYINSPGAAEAAILNSRSDISDVYRPAVDDLDVCQVG